MTNPLPRPLVRVARRALMLGVALAGLGSIAGAAPKPRPRPHHTSGHAARSTTSRKHAAKSHHAAAAVDSADEVTLPTLPTLVQLPSADLTIGSESLRWGAVPAKAGMTQPFTEANAANATSSPLASFNASAERLLSAMLDRARGQLGTRYVFGGSRPGLGLDCSAFARFAMEALGIRLPRTAAQQARVGTPVPRDRTMLKPGDLLTFGRGSKVSHVGIYLGEGHFIHASVSSGRIIETTIDRNRSLFRRWQGARRLIASNDSTTTTSGGF